jgi:hypothetical protein
MIDICWHQKEFQLRRSFAYTVVDREEIRCLGCVYLFPSSRDGCDAEAFCWVRASEAAALDSELFDSLQAWLAAEWPSFRRVAFPGRGVRAEASRTRVTVS